MSSSNTLTAIDVNSLKIQTAAANIVDVETATVGEGLASNEAAQVLNRRNGRRSLVCKTLIVAAIHYYSVSSLHQVWTFLH